MGSTGRKAAYILLLARIILTLNVVLVFAASTTITSTSYRAIVGGQLKVAVVTDLSSNDKGFSKAASTVSANGASCASPVLFSVLAGTASPGVTSGHMFYDVQLNTTGSTPVSHCWQVKLSYTANDGSSVSVGPVAIGTTVVVPPINQIIDCQFDMGTSLPSSPFSYSLSVT